jgi:hypothetical protein
MTITEIPRPTLRPQNLFYETKFATIAALERLQAELERVAGAQIEQAAISREQFGLVKHLCEHAAAISEQQKRLADVAAKQAVANADLNWATPLLSVNDDGAIVGESDVAKLLREAIGRDSVRWCIEGQPPKREYVDADTFAARCVAAAPKYGLEHQFDESDYRKLHAAFASAHHALHGGGRRRRGSETP